MTTNICTPTDAPAPIDTPSPDRRRLPAVRTGPFRLGRRTRVAVLTAHVLTGVGWFGVAASVAFFGYAAAATDDPALRYSLHTAMRVAIALSIPAGLLCAATGIVLALGTRWGLTRYWWLIIKQVITFVVIVTDPLVLLPAIREPLDGGTATEPFGPMTAHVVLLAVATILSTLKPFGRTRTATRAADSRSAVRRILRGRPLQPWRHHDEHTPLTAAVQNRDARPKARIRRLRSARQP
jgi:hypothetical protein